MYLIYYMRNVAWKKKHVKQKVGEFDCETLESLKLSRSLKFIQDLIMVK